MAFFFFSFSPCFITREKKTKVAVVWPSASFPFWAWCAEKRSNIEKVEDEASFPFSPLCKVTPPTSFFPCALLPFCQEPRRGKGTLEASSHFPSPFVKIEMANDLFSAAKVLGDFPLFLPCGTTGTADLRLTPPFFRAGTMRDRY